MKNLTKIFGTFFYIFFILNSLHSAVYGQNTENSDQKDPEILIFSTTHAQETYLKQKKGVIKVEIVSFNPISEVDVNGKNIPIVDNQQVKLEIPFDFISQPNQPTEFLITARTDTGMAQSRFVVHLKSKPKLKKSPFQLISILGIANNDNINSATSSITPETGTKKVLTVVPQYSMPFRKNSTLVFKGIILREGYNNKDYVDKEISYTQLSVGWIAKKNPAAQLSAAAGVSDIRMNSANGLVGEEETSQELFISGKIELKSANQPSWNMSLKTKIKDVAATPSNINYESDAMEIDLSMEIKEAQRLLQPDQKALKISVQASYSVNDAEGKYQDSFTWERAVKLKYKIGNWTPQIKLKTQRKTMDIIDPLKDSITPYYVTDTYTAKLQYQLFKKTLLALDYKNKNGSSNVDSANYTQNLTTLSLTHIF